MKESIEKFIGPEQINHPLDTVPSYCEICAVSLENQMIHIDKYNN